MDSNHQHDIDVKIENGMVITYCKTCGKILDCKPNTKWDNITIGDSMNSGSSQSMILHG